MGGDDAFLVWGGPHWEAFERKGKPPVVDDEDEAIWVEPNVSFSSSSGVYRFASVWMPSLFSSFFSSFSFSFFFPPPPPPWDTETGPVLFVSEPPRPLFFLPPPVPTCPSSETPNVGCCCYCGCRSSSFSDALPRVYPPRPNDRRPPPWWWGVLGGVLWKEAHRPHCSPSSSRQDDDGRRKRTGRRRRLQCGQRGVRVRNEQGRPPLLDGHFPPLPNRPGTRRPPPPVVGPPHEKTADHYLDSATRDTPPHPHGPLRPHSHSPKGKRWTRDRRRRRPGWAAGEAAVSSAMGTGAGATPLQKGRWGLGLEKASEVEAVGKRAAYTKKGIKEDPPFGPAALFLLLFRSAVAGIRSSIAEGWAVGEAVAKEEEEEKAAAAAVVSLDPP